MLSHTCAASGIFTWIRLGGIWFGDKTGGGSGSNHQTDMSYGQMGVSFGNNVLQTSYVSASSYSLYYRSQSFVTAASALNPIQRGGVGLAAAGSGMSLVSVAESSTSAGAFLSRGVFTVGDPSSEAQLITFLNGVPSA